MRSRLALAGLALAVMAGAALPAAAAPTPVDVPTRTAPARPADEPRPKRIELPPGTRAGDTVGALVELSADPVAEEQVESRLAGRRFDRRTVQRQVQREQDAALPRLRSAGASVQGRLDTVLNAVRVRAKVSDLDEIAALPGVEDVQVTRLVTRSNARGAKATGVDQTWQDTGFTGRGQVIGVIDTGIDYTHADFGGAGTTAAFDRNDGDVVERGSFPTAKVTGGYDFVGDTYDPDPSAYSPAEPDRDPLDCDGHGTHVAGTAAGLGVSRDGKTYRGRYGKATLDQPFAVEPGVAPQATLKAYRVFGCDGSTEDAIVIDAIDRAVADGVDVINLSLGSAYGSADDLNARAVDAATRAGVLVVTAAGNAGSGAYLVGSPSAANSALSVAAVAVADPRGATTVASFSSAGPRRGDSAAKPDIAAPGSGVPSARVGSGKGSSQMSGTSMAAPHVAGVAALVRQAHPTWNAAQAKAAITSTGSTGRVAGYATQRVGTGLVQPRQATRTQAYAWTPNGSNGLGFGMNQLGGAYAETQSFRITNRTTAPVTYDLTSGFNPGRRGADLTISPKAVTVAGGATATVAVKLSLTRAEVAALPGAEASDRGGLVTVRGVVVATPRQARAGIGTLRMAFVSVPVPLSSITSTATIRQRGNGSTPAITVRNSGVHAGRADVFQWLLSDAARDVRSSEAPDLTAVGAQSLLPAGGSRSDRMLVVALTMAAGTSTQAVRVFEVELDTNADGRSDYVMAALDSGLAAGRESSGRLRVYTETRGGRAVDDRPAVAPANGSTVLLSVPASAIGVTSRSKPVRLKVRTSNIFDGRGDTVSGTGRFDVFRPALSQGRRVAVQPGRSASIATQVDAARVSQQSRLGWLVVSTDDKAGSAEADRVSLRLTP